MIYWNEFSKLTIFLFFALNTTEIKLIPGQVIEKEFISNDFVVQLSSKVTKC